MLFSIKRVHIAQYTVNFAKSHQGLLYEALKLKLDIWSGDALVFFNKEKTGVKILLADDFGIWVLYKKMSRGRMLQPINFQQILETKEISYGELALLLEGHQYDIKAKKKKFSMKC